MLFSRRTFCMLLTLTTFLLGAMRPLCASVAVSAAASDPLVIIDAGHGGRDGGAVGAGGVLEKDLNLAIALSLEECFIAAGIPVLLTRRTDTLVLDEGEDVAGQRKQKDLYNRVAIANRYPNATLVSIHMNAYPVAKYRGLQVYYRRDSAESGALARRITERVRRELDPVYTRVPNFRGDELYLLSHAEGRAVLVECGFLSNEEEKTKLLDKDYQKKLSFCIFYAIMEE